MIQFQIDLFCKSPNILSLIHSEFDFVMKLITNRVFYSEIRKYLNESNYKLHIVLVYTNDYELYTMKHEVINSRLIIVFTDSCIPWVIPIYVMINWQPWNWHHETANFDHFMVTSYKNEARDVSLLNDQIQSVIHFTSYIYLFYIIF